ncbi:hypothetical protein IE81DRAFT_62680 [Ceraceosorus guamensis]|uniref:Uncharacterized protein n=1 Tax=Ceraceosorus guamensis TaxID=1522189 RepID=A0A316VNS0_9BASI|nr:hypothetical protein IE81DRAFT_62680 [Ceraceosorus guamensis]PWN38970.1 hypothetical protein IE81DRAFT_62680 [Ceraceosorus guamensis]
MESGFFSPLREARCPRKRGARVKRQLLPARAKRENLPISDVQSTTQRAEAATPKKARHSTRTETIADARSTLCTRFSTARTQLRFAPAILLPSRHASVSARQADSTCRASSRSMSSRPLRSIHPSIHPSHLSNHAIHLSNPNPSQSPRVTFVYSFPFR